MMKRRKLNKKEAGIGPFLKNIDLCRLSNLIILKTKLFDKQQNRNSLTKSALSQS